jgi:hypothetical protein
VHSDEKLVRDQTKFKNSDIRISTHGELLRKI